MGQWHKGIGSSGWGLGPYFLPLVVMGVDCTIPMAVGCSTIIFP